jgi:hypothetical protein
MATASLGCNVEETGLAGGGPPVTLSADAAVRRPPPTPASIDPPPPVPPPPSVPAPEGPTPTAAPAPDAGVPSADAAAGPGQPPAGTPPGAPPVAPPGAPPAVPPGTPPSPPEAPPNPTSPPPVPPTPADFCNGGEDLVVCLPFDGDARDLSPDRRFVRVQGITFEPGRRGQAARFGPGREVQVADDFRLFQRVLSVEANVRPLSLPPQGRRAGIVHSDNQYGVFLLGPEGDVECRTPAGGAIARRVVRPSVWTHILCIFEDDQVEVVINGDIAAQAEVAYSIPVRGDDGPHIGTTSFEGGPLIGLIDEVRIWRARRDIR